MSPTALRLRRFRHLAVTALLLLATPMLQAQVRSFGNRPTPSNRTSSSSPTGETSRNQASTAQQPDTSATKGLIFEKETPDSVLRQKVFYFNHIPHGVKIDQLLNPSLDPTGAQYNDCLDAMNGNHYLSTGVIGHPHLGLYPTFAEGLALNLQADEYEGYAKTPENIHFFQTQTPYSLLSYGGSLGKDYTLRVAHTQNVIPGWNVAFDYRLINPEGVFSNSAARNHYLDATTNYFSDDSRLQAQAGAIYQRYTVDENGGLSDDSYFTSGRQTNQAGLPMRLSGAGTMTLRHNIFGKASYNLVRQAERTRTRDSLAARSDTVGTDSIRTVLDTITLTDTLRVGTPRTLNPGIFGIDAAYSRHKRASYMPSGADSTLWSLVEASLFWTNDAYPDYRWHNPLKINIGITPRLLQVNLPGHSISAASALNPFAKAELTLGSLTLSASGETDHTLQKLLHGQHDADRQGSLALALPLDSAGHNTLNASLNLQHCMPELRMLLSSDDPLKAQDAQRYEIQYLRQCDSGHLPLLDLTLRATHLSHAHWYDTALAVRQGDNALWLLQASLTAQLRLGWLHIDLQQLLQHSTDDEQVGVPLWASKNSIYADMRLFRNALRMQAGVDIRFHTRFFADAYDPATGLFHQQEDSEVGGYLWGDLFLNIQVRRATIYLKAGHLNALWEQHPSYLLLPHYPGQRFGLLWGMTWHFFD